MGPTLSDKREGEKDDRWPRCWRVRERELAGPNLSVTEGGADVTWVAAWLMCQWPIQREDRGAGGGGYGPIWPGRDDGVSRKVENEKEGRGSF